MDSSQDPELQARKDAVKDTGRCPYCDQELTEHDVSGNALGGWGSPILQVCFNDDCPYYRKSVEVLSEQGAVGATYRYAFDPSRDWGGPIAAGPAPKGQR